MSGGGFARPSAEELSRPEVSADIGDGLYVNMLVCGMLWGRRFGSALRLPPRDTIPVRGSAPTGLRRVGRRFAPSPEGPTPEDYPGYDPASGFLKLEYLEEHPRDAGDFYWEDVGVCEKMQRSLGSPMHRVEALAAGRGAESPITFFQQNVLDFLEPARAPAATGI